MKVQIVKKTIPHVLSIFILLQSTYSISDQIISSNATNQKQSNYFIKAKVYMDWCKTHKKHIAAVVSAITVLTLCVVPIKTKPQTKKYPANIDLFIDKYCSTKNEPTSFFSCDNKSEIEQVFILSLISLNKYFDLQNVSLSAIAILSNEVDIETRSELIHNRTLNYEISKLFLPENLESQDLFYNSEIINKTLSAADIFQLSAHGTIQANGLSITKDEFNQHIRENIPTTLYKYMIGFNIAHYLSTNTQAFPFKSTHILYIKDFYLYQTLIKNQEFTDILKQCNIDVKKI